MLTRQECRQADEIAIKRFGIPSIVLMENAGRNCAEKLICHSAEKSETSQSVLILCGPGNNGGDGFVIARHLYNAGVAAKVILFQAVESYSGDALTNLLTLSRLRLPVIEFDAGWTEQKLDEVFGKICRDPTTWVVDALLGTGAKGEPREPLARVLKLVNAMNVQRMAIDIPTGLDADTGIPSKATFRADVTCTFIDQKAGFANPESEPFVGVVEIVDIGAPPEITAS